MTLARPQIEHPHSIGITNKKVLDAVTVAYSTALDLAGQGFIVKSIVTSADQPRLQLHSTGHCHRLQSFVKKQGHDRRGHYQIHAALINGCEINWETRRTA